ncbi:MAG: mechanosensitive ion channel domain-containing protein [Myxococcota bacterium]
MNVENIKTLLTELIAGWGLKIVGVLFALFAGWIVAGSLSRSFVRLLEAKDFDRTLTRFFGTLVRYAVITGVVLGCLGVFGIQTASFAAVIASAGLAIGLAFQGTLSNFAAGVMLLVFRPFKVGDVVNCAGHTGVIAEIELFTTEMTGLDNRRITIPNTKVFGDTIVNLTHHEKRRCDITVGVAYDADLDETRKVLEGAVASCDMLIDEPESQIFLQELGDSAVVWQLRCWCKTEDYWAVHEFITRAAKVHLDEHKLGIPFPQLDLHLVEAPAPVQVVRKEA